MRITKEYDVEALAGEIDARIDTALDAHETDVYICITDALDILEVLMETARREKEHQTLDSAITFMEMEDGTKTNEMEYHENKPESILDVVGKEKENGN